MSLLDATTRRRTRLVVQSMLVLLLSLWPCCPVLASALAQAEANRILLGEFVHTSLAQGEAAIFALTIPADGVYTVVHTGAESASDFQLRVVDADGATLSDDVLQDETTLELAAGDHRFQFTAQAAANLDFVIGREGGSMSTDPGAAGELVNGDTFLANAVTEPLYATVTIAPLPSPQQMIVLVMGDGGDVYAVELLGETQDDYVAVTTDEAELLQTVTTGGVYTLTITPVEGGDALQVSVYLGGSMPELAPGVAVEGELRDAEETDAYQFTVDAPGAIVTVTATSAQPLSLSAGFMPNEDAWSAYSYGDEAAVLSFVAPEAGTYFFDLTTDDVAGASYTVFLEASARAEVLPLGESIQGAVAGGASTSYLVEVAEPEQFLLVALAGPEDDDLDLVIRQYQAGQETAYDSSTSMGSREIVALYVQEPGAFIVVVDGGWADEEADYVLSAMTGAVADLLEVPAATAAPKPNAVPAQSNAPGKSAAGIVEQWAVSAEASSQYSDDSWSAQQMVGEPDTPEPGDTGTAWAAATPDLQIETLLLTYAQAVVPTGIEIYESYNPGAVTRIELLDPASDEWVVVWEGLADTAGEEIAVFSPALVPADFAATQVRLTVDEPALPGWNEIDAVKLIGLPE